MSNTAKDGAKVVPVEDVKDRSGNVRDVSSNDETSCGGDNSGTDVEPHREGVTPDLDPDMTD